MRIGNVEVCDDCGAAWTPHTPDCPNRDRLPPMFERALENAKVQAKIEIDADLLKRDATLVSWADYGFAPQE